LAHGLHERAANHVPFMSCLCIRADETAALRDLPAEPWRRFFREVGGNGVRRITVIGDAVTTGVGLQQSVQQVKPSYPLNQEEK
jgi:hypothetical protein